MMHKAGRAVFAVVDEERRTGREVEGPEADEAPLSDKRFLEGTGATVDDAQPDVTAVLGADVQEQRARHEPARAVVVGDL